VGARLDHSPELLFTLRQVDPRQLVGAAARGAVKSIKPAKNQLAEDGLANIFGIELEARKAPRGKPRRATR
jgi:hypothetical protein